MKYMIYDTRGLDEPDAVYTTAVQIADEIMEGVERLHHSSTLEAATLFITNSGAQLVLLTRSDDNEPIDRMFDSTLKRVTYESESGNLHTYVIPILEAEK
ncbi:MAG: hypothetical protein JW779_13160 [Candidatus Thorarchaeota archaeon]|nr:hypothetical protein [Candidatus Thorarchaeota archaeon]